MKTTITPARKLSTTVIGCNPTQGWWKPAWAAATQHAPRESLTLLGLDCADASVAWFQIRGNASQLIRVELAA